MSPGSRVSQSPELATLIVPPFLSDGLKTLPTAALTSAVPPEPLSPPSFPSPLLPPPPQADRPSAETAVSGREALHRLLLIVRLRPFLRSGGALFIGWFCLASPGSSASRSPSPKRLKASTVMKMARPGHSMKCGIV